MKSVLLFLILLNCSMVNAQHIFSEKFKDCNTEQFSLESDTTNARIDDNKFIDVVTSGFGEIIKSNISGKLFLQIIVDKEGNSCLLSLENKTNLTTGILNLKSTIDEKLIWNKPTDIVSAIVLLTFSDNQISLKRFGLNNDIGMHEISEKKTKTSKSSIFQQNTNSENNPKTITDSITKAVWKMYNTSNSIIPYNMSRSVEIDTNGVIWYCTDHGIVKIDRKNWKVFTADNSPLITNKYGNTITWGLAIDKQNRIWIQSLDSLILYDGINWTNVTKEYNLKRISHITTDKKGAVWFGSFYGLLKYYNNKWQTYNTGNSKIPTNNVGNAFLDNKGILWVATQDKGVLKFFNGKWTVYNTQNSILPSNSISCVNEDKNGNIWIATNEVKGKGGLVKIDTKNKWKVYNKENSPLPTNTVWEIGIENNILWLGMHDGGLVRFDGTNWEIYNTSNSIMPNNYVTSIAFDQDGGKWIATFDGLVYTNR